MRTPGPDDICALCDEYSVKLAEPEYAAIGMGRCLVQAEQRFLSAHVAWDNKTCVSFRLDRPNLAARRQYVAVQRRAATTKEGTEE